MKTLLVALFLLSFTYAQTDTTQTQKKDEALVSLMSSGIQNSANFETDRPWQLMWINFAEDMVFSIYLMKAESDELADVLVSSTARRGEAYSNKKGKFYLKIVGMSDWLIAANFQDKVKKKN